MSIITRFTEMVGCEVPIQLAGMGAVSTPDLAAAVSNAGGLGMLTATADDLSADVDAALAVTAGRPLGVNFLMPFFDRAMLEAVAPRVRLVEWFWGWPDPVLVSVAHAAGALAAWQVGSRDEAAAAADAGCDLVVAQGVEAGGHVRGTVTTLALLPAARDAVGPDIPILAAGGFADGRGLAAALALGADGAVFGTRFLASKEVAANAAYQQRILSAEAEDTVHTTLYDQGWPDAPHRVIRTKVVEEWERAGKPPTGKRPGEGKAIGKMVRGGFESPPLVKYSVMSATKEFEGDIEELPFYAGMSVSLVHDIRPAGEIVKRIAEEARGAITGRLAAMVR